MDGRTEHKAKLNDTVTGKKVSTKKKALGLQGQEHKIFTRQIS